MFTEDELLPISALQHLVFCERQCALIHIEQVWSENRFTAEGRIMHERVHEAAAESRGAVRIVRGLRLRSLALGLIGVADVVEFWQDADGIELVGRKGCWRVFPIEYKRGKPKPDRCDEVQLCAQAMCLEEMLAGFIPEAALFYGKTRRRKDVPLDDDLRSLTKETAERLHNLVRAGVTPKAAYEKKCQSCSLLSLCMPQTTSGRKSARQYLKRAIASSLEGTV